jgi:hypothetical protein
MRDERMDPMDFELSQAQADQFDGDGFLMVDRIVDDAAVDRAVARFEPLFRGEFETGVRPDEVNWQEGRDSPELARQICCGCPARACTSTMCCGSRRARAPWRSTRTRPTSAGSTRRK